ncbi:MAG: endonuclease/exonuclease/phosphatase family protein [Elusimicrobia bacterium]|nr:endonuclease/exonuclease/phosphatase family protein [Elusimicrobiota bacterium]
MKVMTLNINRYGSKHGPWTKRRDLIANTIRRADPDIVALQAVGKDPSLERGKDQAAQLAELLPGFDGVVYQAAEENDDGRSEGLAVLSRLPIAEAGHLKLTTVPDGEDAAKRILVYALFPLPAGSLRLFNAHISSAPRQAFNNVEEILPYLRSFPEEALLVGDFNLTPDTDLLKPLAREGWTDAWARLHPHEGGYTFESDRPSKRIDYIWVTDDLKRHVRSVQVLSAEEDGVRLSDHAGLLADLSIVS